MGRPGVGVVAEADAPGLSAAAEEKP